MEPEHLLLAIVHDVDCVAARMLITWNVNLQKIVQDLLQAAGVDVKEYQEEMQEEGRARRGAIELFCTDLTAEAAEGKLDPVIGRSNEIYRLMQILSRRTKNNPCLIGEPGVGKDSCDRRTCTAHCGRGSAGRNARKRVLTLDLPGMIARSFQVQRRI